MVISTRGSVKVAAFLRISIVVCSFRIMSARIETMRDGEKYLDPVRALSVS